MPLFEIKVDIEPQQKPLLITQLSLEYLRSFSDTDTFLKTEPGKPKEKIKRLDGVVKKYILVFDGEMFVIDGKIMSEEKADQLQLEQHISLVLTRRKDEYLWPELGLRVAFDEIVEIPGKLFLEAYAETRELMLRAKQGLIALGYTRWVNKTYDELVRA